MPRQSFLVTIQGKACTSFTKGRNSGEADPDSSPARFVTVLTTDLRHSLEGQAQ